MQGRVHVMGNSLALKAKSAKGSYYVHAAICTVISLFIMQLLTQLICNELVLRYLLRLFDCLAHPNLSAPFATDQK
jgi:hypothetical protein